MFCWTLRHISPVLWQARHPIFYLASSFTYPWWYGSLGSSSAVLTLLVSWTKKKKKLLHSLLLFSLLYQYLCISLPWLRLSHSQCCRVTFSVSPLISKPVLCNESCGSMHSQLHDKLHETLAAERKIWVTVYDNKYYLNHVVT